MAPATAANFRKSARFVPTSSVNVGVVASALPPTVATSDRIPSSAPRRSCPEVGRWTELSEMKLYAMSSLACPKDAVRSGDGDGIPAVALGAHDAASATASQSEAQ